MKRLVEGMVLAIVAAGLAGAPATGVAAGFQNTSQSATSTAMGGVGIANPHEPNASFYNPALMSQQEGFNIYVGPTVILPSTSYEPFDDGEVVETDRGFFPPPNGHADYSITENLSVGLGATLPYGLGITWPDDWAGREDIQHQSLQTLNITPAVSYSIPDTDLTVAAGGQVAFSSVELRRQIIPRSDTEIDTHLGGNGQGVGGLAGILFQPTDDLTFGLNYKSAIKLNYDGVVNFQGEEGTPFENQFVDGDVSTSLTLPHVIGVGAGWQLDRLFLELDLTYTTWSTYDEVVIDFEKDRPQETSTLQNNWNDSGSVRFGAQYEVTNGLPVRLGLAYDMTPIPDSYLSASLPGNNRAVASLGVGYTTTYGIRFDLAYQVVSALEREVTDSENAPPGRYKTTAHLIGINFGYGYERGRE